MEGSFIIAQIGTILTSDYLEVGTLSSGPSIVFIYLHMFEDSSPGVDPEISERGGWDTCPLASYLDSFDFSENSIKIIQNFIEKGVAMTPRSTPKSALAHSVQEV